MRRSGNVLLTIVLAIVALAGVLTLDTIIVNAFTTENLSAGYDGRSELSGLVDERGVFKEEPDTYASLQKRIRQCSENTELNILIFIAGDEHWGCSEAEIERYNDDLYDETFGEYTDGVGYYMDLSGQSPAHDDISVSGKAAVIIEEEQANGIFSALDHYLPKSGAGYGTGDIRDAVEVFCDKLESYHSEYKPSNYKYFHDKEAKTPVYVFVKDGETYVTTGRAPGSKFKRLLIAELIGTIVGLVTYIVTRKKYKFKNTANPSVYVAREKSALTERSDVLIRSYVTKHKISSSSGGSRGGFGGGGGHGGSHGHFGHSR
ncbi:MAG TPA: hypothetical protein P5191_07195 [Ruminococcus sp.]|nr:hypothetical protein [Ruminococcus sp.]